MRIAIYTLGCKVNQYETQAMEAELIRRGHTLVPFEERADAYLVNTCAVTAMSGHKSRQIIRRCRRQNPEALVGVCGCYAQTEPEAVAGLEVDLVSGTEGRMAFLDNLEALAAQRRRSPLVTVCSAMANREFEDLPAGGLTGRTRAMLKIEDGCVSFCSYCVIPYARGPVRSLPLERAVEEAGRLCREGYKELVLTGIEISSWGQEWREGPELADLITAVCAAAPSCRIRLGSLEPRTVTEDFCRRVSSCGNLCPHFHLSLQSGCDATLERMNRRYTTQRYLQSAELLRQWFDRPGITTDLIVGFPGETEEEFQATMDFLDWCAFSAVHVFPYSRRAGTKADAMPGQVAKAVKEERGRRAARVAKDLQQAYLQSWVGQTLSVLFEEKKEAPAQELELAGEQGTQLWRGHAPNYVEVKAACDQNLHNVERPVRITAAAEGCLIGRVD